MNRIIIFVILVISATQTAFSTKPKSDANIIGHVTSEGHHIPFATVAIKGTTIGTATDETGHYQLINLPVGEQVIVVSVIGYKSQNRIIMISANKTIELKFELEADLLNLEEVVVSSNRGEQKRTEAPVIVNTISPELFSTTQSVTLGEGLNYSPGLRIENNCQNCGFSQVRMNGMDGAHSQILINSRPIFSGLAGVYGLELIPTSIIGKVEIVRGGGSVLFGSNAVAGTINIILKEPKVNTYEIGSMCSVVGVGVDGSAGTASDYSVNADASVISDDRKTGVSLFGFTRNREVFDANNDSFSEIAKMSNLTFGTRFFHKFGSRDKLAIDFFAIKEQREGGNMFDKPYHERDIAEALTHNMYVTSFSYERYFRDYDMLTVYGSGQFLNRDSYYGANYSLEDYGNTKDRTINMGVNYKASFNSSSLIIGVDNTSGFLIDYKLGYPEYTINSDGEIDIVHLPNTLISDQSSITTGTFVQYDLKWDKFKFALGARYDRYKIKNYGNEGEEPKIGDVISPRLSVMYNILNELKARVSYSQGYRAPQIFDEDLHIETSGSRQVKHENDPNLKQETSNSYMASLDYNGLVGTVYTGFLLEGFYTRLDDAFVSEVGEPNADGEVIYTRKNAEGGAVVQGVNVEFKLKPLRDFTLTSGYTIQSSTYDDAQEFNEKNFLRTPNQYGYLVLDWDFIENLCISATGNYTGSMLVPYYGPNTDPNVGELRTSGSFFDMGFKLEYDIKLNGATLKLSSGIKNILNAYQFDFDEGVNRDPSYIYGPFTPRTIYFGVKIGNFL